MMEYKGYRAAVSYDTDGKVLHGEVVGTRDVIFFEAESVADLEKEFKLSIDDYLAACAERGRQPDKRFSGRVPLRLRPEVHRAATEAAHSEGKSLNAWLSEAIEQATGRAHG